jgi:hypothetical protein
MRLQNPKIRPIYPSPAFDQSRSPRFRDINIWDGTTGQCNRSYCTCFQNVVTCAALRPFRRGENTEIVPSRTDSLYMKRIKIHIKESILCSYWNVHRFSFRELYPRNPCHSSHHWSEPEARSGQKGAHRRRSIIPLQEHLNVCGGLQRSFRRILSSARMRSMRALNRNFENRLSIIETTLTSCFCYLKSDV